METKPCTCCKKPTTLVVTYIDFHTRKVYGSEPFCLSCSCIYFDGSNEVAIGSDTGVYL